MPQNKNNKLKQLSNPVQTRLIGFQKEISCGNNKITLQTINQKHLSSKQFSNKINQVLKSSILQSIIKMRNLMSQVQLSQDENRIRNKQKLLYKIFSVPKDVKSIKCKQNPQHQSKTRTKGNFFSPNKQQKMQSPSKIDQQQRIKSKRQGLILNKNCTRKKWSTIKQKFQSFDDSEDSFCKKYNTLTQRIYNYGNRSKTLQIQNPNRTQKQNKNFIKYVQKDKTGQKEQISFKDNEVKLKGHYIPNEIVSTEKQIGRHIYKKSRLLNDKLSLKDSSFQFLCKIKDVKQQNGNPYKKLKILIKSKSNNKVLSQNQKLNFSVLSSGKKSDNIDTRNAGNQQQTIKFIKLTSYDTQIQVRNRKSTNFTWKGERMHNQSTQRQLIKNQSNKNSKNNKLLNGRNINLGEKTHVVISENNKTKINAFHNSILLRKDSQQINVLTSLVRDLQTKNTLNQYKVDMPRQLGINKLKMQQKRNISKDDRSEKGLCALNIQQVFDKKIKQKRKECVPKIRTERNTREKVDMFQPWQINDARKYNQNESYFCHNQNEHNPNKINYY